jgi:hypothetical protein
MLPVCFKHGWGILLYFKHGAGMKTSSWQRQSPITDSQTVQVQTCTDIISRVKPTRCTNVSNLFYFGMTICMFRTVFPSIIRSLRLYIQQQAWPYECQMYWHAWTWNSHSSNYCFCLTNITRITSKSKHTAKYPDLPLSMRHVPHSEEFPVPGLWKVWFLAMTTLILINF